MEGQHHPSIHKSLKSPDERRVRAQRQVGETQQSLRRLHRPLSDYL